MSAEVLMLALTFDPFFPRKQHRCDHPIPTSAPSAIEHKDTNTTSGSGSSEAANCRKPSEYNVESITQVWLLPCIPASSSSWARTADGYQQRQSAALSQEELSSHLVCVSLAPTIQFGLILLNKWRSQPRTWMVLLHGCLLSLAVLKARFDGA